MDYAQQLTKGGDPICSFCEDLGKAHLIIPLQNILTGKQANCQWCQLLHGAICSFNAIEEVDSIALTRDGSLLILVLLNEENHRRKFFFELYTEHGDSPKLSNIGPARNVSTAENNIDVISPMIKNWLQDCTDKHPACSVRHSDALPSRVIDVGSSSDEVRLHDGSGQEGRYAALSHCWGHGKPVTTTRDNINAHKEYLHFDAQSKTFMDAVDITRALGLRYIWIDSLCIIQDDPEDWAREAAKMSDVYRNAVVTLSADGASDTSGGLLANTLDRGDIHKANSFPIKSPDDGHLVTVYARRRAELPSHPVSFPHSGLEKAQEHPTKLSTRGWVVQERILSPRMVHFYQQELVWSCYSHRRCECRLLPGAPLSSTSEFRRLLVSSALPLPLPASEEQDQQLDITGYDLCMEWPSLVAEFTSKDLSYPQDRLPAISGLATLVQERLPRSLQYLAGHWSVDLDYSLLWLSDHKTAAAAGRTVERIATATESYAPSWSWASVAGPVRFIPRHRDQFSHRRTGGDELEPVWSVLRASTIPKNPANTYGPVQYGFVTARGQTLSIYYDRQRRLWRPEAHDVLDLSSLSLGDADGDGRDQPVGRNLKEPQREPVFVFDVESEFARDGEPADADPRGYILLRAATYIWGGQWSTLSTEVVALFLMQVSVDPPAFRRRGVVLHAFDSENVWQDLPEQTVILC
ncbi:heterokaryon incompatibility protein-domain-containing protein [Xylariales sp. PMI_506]|nr:heterokaryon incompatibility protein-domain-containing protein [Xylariales sp. PMI_506]